MSIARVCGYLMATNKLYWINASDSPLMKAVTAVLNFPVGYIILSGSIALLGLYGWYGWVDSNK